MKKLVLLVSAVAFMAMGASALTNMCVEQMDGTIVRYDVESVKQVYYEEVASADTTASDVIGVSVSGKIDDYYYVDLGLRSKTMWATCNVGASKPEEYGDYFAWGETSPKETYRLDNYKFSEDSCNTFTKYVLDSVYGAYDGLTTLDVGDDAAVQNWGRQWRMPTLEQWDELVFGCDWKWMDDFNGSGVAGQVGTSKANGNTIFLPATGGKHDNTSSLVGFFGYYWSSTTTLDAVCYMGDGLTTTTLGANYFLLFDGGVTWDWSAERRCGYTVRAVVVW